MLEIQFPALICANNELVARSDELWSFGRISDGVEHEIILARELKMPVKFFEFDTDVKIFNEITEEEANNII